MPFSILRFSLSMFFIYVGISSLQFHSIILESKGFSGTLLGVALMMGYISALSAPFFIAWWSPKFQNPRTPLYCILAMAGITLPLLAYLQSPYILLPTYFIHTFCVWCVFPLHMTYGMDVCRDKGNSFFFLIRSLGTLGFVAGCIATFFFVESTTLQWVYLAMGVSFLIATLVLFVPTPFFPKQLNHNPAPRPATYNVSTTSLWQEWKAIYKDSFIRKLILPIALVSCGNTMATSVQGNYLIHSFAGTKSTVSMAWILCTGFEIPIMLFCAFLIKRWNVSLVVMLGVTGTFIRLVGMSFSESLSQLFFFFTLHGFFYAGVVTGLGVCLDKIHQSKHSAKQALFSLTYASVPSILGSFCAGFVWEHFSLKAVYGLAFGISCVGFILFIPLAPSFYKRFVLFPNKTKN